MSVVIPALLLIVGLVVGWLIGRRRTDAAPIHLSDVPVAVDARWQVDARAVCDARTSPSLLADADGVILYANAGGAITTLRDVTEDVDFEEARRTFSAAVSHELRTPLARILGLAESLALPNTDDEREELVTQIEHEVDGMRKLIDEMLLLAALDRGRLAVADGVVDASEVAFSIVESAKLRRIGRGRDITFTAPVRVEVPVAPRLFEVVVQNLVDNALIHGGPDAVVRVSVVREDEQAVLAVTDSGIGIPSQHLPFVFQRFYRGEASRTGPGSGLGLALVKHIVEAHSGTVLAESDGVSGTTLRVTLPLAS